MQKLQHLPGPLCIVGNPPSHNPPGSSRLHKLSPADVAVVALGVQGVEAPCAAFSTDRVVVNGYVDLWGVLKTKYCYNNSLNKNLYLAYEVILVVALCRTKFKEVLIEVDTVPSRNWIAGPEIRTELVSGVEPSEGSRSLEVRGSNPEGLVGVAGHEVVLKLGDLGSCCQLGQVAFKEFYIVQPSALAFVIKTFQLEEHYLQKSKCVSPAAWLISLIGFSHGEKRVKPVHPSCYNHCMILTVSTSSAERN